jgi:hypothetical protein
VPSLARIWLVHAAAFSVGCAVAYGTIWMISEVFISEDADWVGALSVVLIGVFVAGPVGVAAYAKLMALAFGARMGLRGWLTAIGMGIAGVVLWMVLIAQGLTSVPVGLVLTLASMFGVGGALWQRHLRQGVS